VQTALAKGKLMVMTFHGSLSFFNICSGECTPVSPSLLAVFLADAAGSVAYDTSNNFETFSFSSAIIFKSCNNMHFQFETLNQSRYARNGTLHTDLLATTSDHCPG